VPLARGDRRLDGDIAALAGMVLAGAFDDRAGSHDSG
jgi:hypothetical protein